MDNPINRGGKIFQSYREYEVHMVMWGVKEAVRRLHADGMSRNELTVALYGSKGGAHRTDKHIKEAIAP